MIHAELFAYSTSAHLSQLYTGFSMLAEQRQIKLTQQSQNYPHASTEPRRTFHGLFAIIDKRLSYYDVRDSCEIDTDTLDMVDAYFKRSYLDSAIPANHHKVRSLGLNYAVYPDDLDRWEFQRVLGQQGFLRAASYLARKTTGISRHFVPTSRDIACAPMFDQTPTILFMTQARDPDELPADAKAKREERDSSNTMRAACIRLLRKKFGGKFHGAFTHNTYARQYYPDALIPEVDSGNKNNYLKVLRQHPICVTTTGLHGSIGWKMAEYVAKSKAIVSERLNYQVPGTFVKDRNYLEFATPEECVEQVQLLVTDQQLRTYIMQENWNYYCGFLRPDRLVWRTLELK